MRQKDSKRKKVKLMLMLRREEGDTGKRRREFGRGGYIGCRKETKKGHVSVPHEWRFLNQRHPERQLQLSCHVTSRRHVCRWRGSSMVARPAHAPPASSWLPVMSCPIVVRVQHVTLLQHAPTDPSKSCVAKTTTDTKIVFKWQ